MFEPISLQFATISGLWARLGILTLYSHMTFARFSQGLADLYREDV